MALGRCLGKSSQRARPGSSLVDLPFRRLGVQLGGADGAVIQEALHLIERHAFAEHLGGSPVTEIVRMYVG